MYYEEKWIEGRLYWRSSPTGEWMEASAEKLNRMLKEAQDELRALRILATNAVARFDELEREGPQPGWRTATERRANITRNMLAEVLGMSPVT